MSWERFVPICMLDNTTCFVSYYFLWARRHACQGRTFNEEEPLPAGKVLRSASQRVLTRCHSRSCILLPRNAAHLRNISLAYRAQGGRKHRHCLPMVVDQGSAPSRRLPCTKWQRTRDRCKRRAARTAEAPRNQAWSLLYGKAWRGCGSAADGNSGRSGTQTGILRTRSAVTPIEGTARRGERCHAGGSSARKDQHQRFLGHGLRSDYHKAHRPKRTDSRVLRDLGVRSCRQQHKI